MLNSNDILYNNSFIECLIDNNSNCFNGLESLLECIENVCLMQI